MIKKKIILSGILFSLIGCTPHIYTEDYQDDKPQLIVNNYYNGSLKAWGIYQSWEGRVLKRYCVVLQGQWQNNAGILTEQYHYADGSFQTRTWRIQLTDQHHFTATADGIKGVAHGEQFGNVIHMYYIVESQVGSTAKDLHADDWMYLVHDTGLIDKIIFSKYGVKVGEEDKFVQK